MKSNLLFINILLITVGNLAAASAEMPQFQDINLPNHNADLLKQQPEETPPECPPEENQAEANDQNLPEACQQEEEETSSEADIEITVTGTRTPRALQDSPGTITIIDDDDIQNLFIRDIKDLIRYEPGVSVRNRPTRAGNSSINIRGIEGNRVLIQIDGVRVPDIYVNTSRDLVDFESLSKVEIIRGPASTLYGSDAIGGVVSFITKDPEDYLNIFNRPFYVSGKVNYNTSDYGLAETLTLAGGDEKLSGLLQYTRRDQNELQNYGGIAPNPQDVGGNNFFSKVVFRPNDNNTFRLTGELLDRNTETDVRSSAGFNPFTRLTTVSQFAEDDVRRGRISLSHDYANPNSSLFQNLRWQVYYQDADTTEEVETRFINGARQNIRRVQKNSFSQQIIGGDVQLQSNFKTGDINHRLTYGFDLFNTATTRPRDATEFNQTTGAVTKNVIGELFPNKTFPDTNTLRGGVYVQNEIEFADGRITLIPGIRYDYYQLSPNRDDDFNRINTQNSEVKGFSDSAISPRLGIVAKVTPEVALFAQYARGFRSPPYDDATLAFTNFAFGYTVLPNANLKPETSDSYEVGIRGSFPQGKFSLTGFYNRYDNFIENVQVGVLPIGGRPFQQFQSQNIKGATIYGIEAKGEYRFNNTSDGVSLFGGLAYAVGDNKETNQPLDSIDPFKAVLGLRYRSPGDIWGAELATTVVADKDRVSSSDFFKSKAYTVVDLLGYYNFNRNTTLNLGIFNLFNERYIEWSDVRGVNASDRFLDLYTQPGINFAASLTVRF
jgi:hemoglobin/transferrin/lactoferrin receptor protein